MVPGLPGEPTGCWSCQTARSKLAPGEPSRPSPPPAGFVGGVVGGVAAGGVRRGGRAPKIKYVTQADVRPPRFVVFSTGFLEAGYRRFLERKLRERWGFQGTPIDISVKVREGRGSDRRG